ncbi:hypothetical protein JIO05_00330 [Pediococcus acidilactici]|jgi:hypothetical protein|uniref:hypothetical protein n=1 Tax=Pediococcus acidilactici TaxID=1254 RepID=UPI0006B3FD9B|nr:hypothetical protein [Pediococcus acidilactici]KAF0371614.1 hypothetical protein GBO58_07075 [Pediococcus acidilactici]KAF0382571.1 hypothetical protein GBO62_06990 [Pediococcus acidilactici]KAF0456404.1 hypothetical protein GBP02_07000 [Pediococcus acidilactici]KAF0475918.1 hypothetical protein GBP10_07285 [Pediococcus acidilactici]KAF0536199.1 hypothetical protein GBP37_07295 [Pediococcus acidilactici]
MFTTKGSVSNEKIDVNRPTGHTVFSALITKDNFGILSPGAFYQFEETSEGNYLGTLPEKEETTQAMEKVAKNPQNYYGWFANSNVYNDNKYQLTSLTSIIYADFHK